MANLAKFRELLAAEADQSKGLPYVTLRQSTDLGQAFSRVVTIDTRKEGESEGQAAGRYVDEICNSLGDAGNAEAVAVFNDSVEAFTEKIRDAWESLDGIKETAGDLGEGMEKVASEMLSADPYVLENQKFAALSEDYPVFSWPGVNAIGPREDITTAVNGLVVKGQQNTSQVDKRLFDIVMNGFDKYTKFDVVQIDDAGRQAMVDQLKAICVQLADADIGMAVDILLGLNRFPETYNVLKYLPNASAASLFTNIKTLDDFIARVYPVVESVIAGQIQVAEDKKQTLLANATALDRFCRIAAYYEIMQRDYVLKNTLLLQGGLINADQKSVFEQAGGTTAMIAHYLRQMYKDDVNAIPALGISGDAIIKADATLAEKVDEDIKTVNTKLALAKTNSRANAFKRVALDYIAKKVTRENEGITAIDKSTRVNAYMEQAVEGIADAVRQYNVCFVEASINLLVKLEHAGTFVEHLQKKLGAAYLALVSSNSKITDENIKCAEVGVVSDLICEFLVDKLIDVVPAGERKTAPLNVGAAPAPVMPNDPPPTTEEQVKQEPAAEPAQEA